MFRKLPLEEKGAVFVLAALNTPTEICQVESEDWSKLWCFEVFHKLTDRFELSKTYADAYIPMVVSGIPYQQIALEKRDELVQPYLSAIKSAGLNEIQIYTQILITIVELERMDGRGMVMIRNVAHSLKISDRDATWLQNMLVNYLIAQQQQLQHIQEKKDNKYRYMKIGAVAIGAGAVIAFTAGLVSSIPCVKALNWIHDMLPTGRPSCCECLGVTRHFCCYSCKCSRLNGCYFWGYRRWPCGL